MARLRHQNGRQNGERCDERERTVGHRQQVAHTQVGVVAKQGGKFAQQRRERKLRPRGCKGECERIGSEEIAVVHVRQEKRDRSGEHRCRQQQRAVGAIVPMQPEPDGKRRDHERGRTDAEPGCGVGVCHIPKERKDGRGIVVEPRADAARLLKRDRQRIPQSAPRDDGREHHDDAHGGKGECMAELDAPREPEEKKDRHDEHRLQLEGERRADADHAEQRVPGQDKIDAQHGEGCIHAVALSPERAVEHDGRPEEHEEKRRELPRRAPAKQPHELHDGPREQHVKQNAEELDEVQIRQGTAADERQHRQVRYIIIPDRRAQRGKTAVRAEEIDPHAQKIPVVVRDVIQARTAQHKRRRQQQRSAQYVRRLRQHTGAPQQHQRKPGLGGEEQTDADIHGHPSEDTKKRQGDTLLPAENSQNNT